MSDHTVKWKVEVDTAEVEAKLERLVLLAERVEKTLAAGEPLKTPLFATATATPQGTVQFAGPMSDEAMGWMRAAWESMPPGARRQFAGLPDPAAGSA